jgi:PAS domain S-box-containing protein
MQNSIRAATYIPEQPRYKSYRLWLPIAGLAIIYLIAGRLGTLLALPPGYSTALFPASGIALFAILRYGYKIWPGILIGSFLLNGSISVLQQNVPFINFIPIGLIIGLGASGEAIFGAYFLHKFTKSKDPFYQIKNIFIFIVFSSGVSSLISATCGTLTVILSDLSTWNQFNETFLTWWLGDAIGILVITPILILFSTLSSNRFHPKLMGEGIFLVIALVAICKITFGGWLGDTSYPLSFLPFPFLVWAVFRFDKLGVITSVLIVSGISIWETVHGNGPFAISHEQNSSLLLVQTFLGVIASMALILYTDLAEKRRISDSLLRSEEQYKFLADSQPALIWSSGTNKLCTYFNRTWLNFTGRTLEQELGNGWAEGVHPDDYKKCLEVYITAFDKREPFIMEYRLRHNSGSYRWLLDRGTPNYSIEGRFQGYLGTCLDIEESKNYQEELAKYRHHLENMVKERTRALELSNQDLEEFAFLASHDLQEPLRKITTFGDRLREKTPSLNDDANHYLNRMQKAAERMAIYINDLLKYSKATQQPKHYERVSLQNIVTQVLEDLSDQIKKSNATIHLQELPMLEVNPVQFPKLIQNIISNAIKYHREGIAPIVTISSYFNEEIQKWQIEVADNGIGIKEKYFDRIFKPFERLHGQSAFEGSGIGLAICDKIVRRHHGKITVRSKLNEGTTFIIALPEKQSPEI